jgi:hypothetical protein
MASTYSNLKIQLMATGENSATWGNVTNTNMGTALEEAIAGTADVAFSSANVTLTLTDANTTQTARNMRLNLTGTATAGYNLIVPAIEKAYIVNNGTDGTITVKNATGTGIAIPAGKTTWVFNNATNVVDVVTHLTSLTLASALPAVSGGTGQSSYAVGDLLYASTTTALSKLADVATGNALISGGVGVAPAWGKVGLTTHVSGTLPLANGGTNATDAAGARTSLGATTVGGNVFTLTNPSAITFPRFNADNTVSALDAATFRTAIGAGTSSTTGTVTSVAMSVPAFLSIAGSPVTSSGTLAVTLSGTALPIANGGTGSTATAYCSLTANVTGTLPVANGGSGATTLTGILKGNGTLAFTAATAGTDYVVPGGALGTPSSGTLTNCTFPTLNQSTTGSAGSVTNAVTFNNGGAGAASGTTYNGSAIQTISYNTIGAYAASNPSGYTSNVGTVTSVATSGTVSGLTLTGGPISTTGTITLGGTLSVAASNFSSQTANTFLAAPNGAAGVPTFRAVVAADIPTLNQSTTGSAATLTTARTLTIGSTGKTFDGSANVSWTLSEIGAAASGANTDITALDQDITITATGTIAANTIGYRGIPQNAQTATYTLALSDAGKHISITTGGVVVPANSSIAFPIGSTISVYNDSASSQNISITTDTMYLAGTATTGTRALAQRGIATMVKVAATTWVISGGGLT